MNVKTPVAILNEMMAKIRKIPVYELCEDELECCPKVFKCKVTCGKSIAFGMGRSKKEAKQNAAQEVLKKIGSFSQEKQVISAESSKTLSKESKLDQGNFSAVEDLKKLCSQWNLKKPIYQAVTISGLAHVYSHTVKCIVAEFQAIGTGQSRAEAQNNASENMIEQIKNNFHVKDSYKTPINKSDKSIQNLKLSSENSSFLNFDLSKLQHLSVLIRQCQHNITVQNIVNVKQQFQDLLDSAKIDFHHMLLQTMEPVTFMLIIQLDTIPDIIEMSLGGTKEEAELRTINKIVQSLKLHVI